MKAFFQFVLRSTAAFMSTVTTWLVSFIAFSQTFLLASVYALAGGAVVYFSLKQIGDIRTIRNSGLKRREYRYIQDNLKEAKDKINRLQRALFSIRSVDQAKYNLEIMRTVKKIYSNTKHEPHRFYKAEGFYFKHLDSLVELAEKYAFLSKQPTQSREMADSLRDTRRTIYSLGETVKKDLRIMLNDDIDTLHYELDFAQQTINGQKKNDRGLLK
ncbi:protein xpaC [Oceanobacillus piezotolerans]|uniref:Protein xpaC n=1 Tax=Oceanobacillus piezotolerans TaxID=2448030 RepID=A0A498DE16_9BACI|nr:5-bromo-4-chloroindolyl phosphate hydrolysis family protein [Oceanobacillus piezotolerans]RLL46910.1 protein xpaC [Oceanobacillus piezotolerans]